MPKRLCLFLLAATILLPVGVFARGEAEDTTAAAEKGPVTLTCFWRLDPKTAMTLKSQSEMTVFKDLEEKTGVRFDFKHPPVGQEKEQLNLMLASNDLTDLIFWNWWDVPGGPGAVINGGQIVALNDLIDKYAPNMKRELEVEHPDYRKQVTLDDGTYYMIPKFKHELYVRISHGYQVREDFLERVGINPPKTLDEWYTMLMAFKTKDANGNGDPNDEIPFGGYDNGNYSLRRFAYTFGVKNEFCLDNNKVKYGPIQPAYKDFLATMRKWYAEGLIDPDYVSIDRKGFEAKVVGDKIASYAGLMNGHMGKFLGLRKDDPNFRLIGLQPPIGPAGKPYGPMNDAATGDGLAVSSTCKDKAAAMRWGDFLFTEEGIRMINFGREGLTYTMKNGEPIFTDLILNNPDGLPMINALCQHNWAAHAGPGYQLESTFRQIQLPAQQNAVTLYRTTTDTSLLMPPAFPNPEEAETLATMMNDIQTYVDEMFNKFVMAQIPMSDFDNYVKTIERMGVAKATAIWQKVIDRYNAK